jgi:hypothetical protein
MSDLFAPKPTHVVRLEDERKARRKIEDQRRMQFRRAIESYAEQRRLQYELSDFPDLVVADYVASVAQDTHARSVSR